MRDLPEGTVTFLFTDVEGSTRLLHELGAERCSEASRAQADRARGGTGQRSVEVDTQGDAFFFAFPTAPGACRRDVVVAPEPGRSRAGLHTGTPVLTDEGYVGGDVHRAARIAAAGHGGQILVSAATAALLEGGELIDLGEHRFRDRRARARVPARRRRVPSRPEPPADELLARDTFLGRGRELAEVVDLLQREELLPTLTGPERQEQARSPGGGRGVGASRRRLVGVVATAGGDRLLLAQALAVEEAGGSSAISSPSAVEERALFSSTTPNTCCPRSPARSPVFGTSLARRSS